MLKKTLPLALLSLAAVASAQSTSVSSSSLIASYTLGSGVTFGGYTAFEYDHLGSNETGFDDDGGKAIALFDGGATHSHADGTTIFSMGSVTSAFLHSNDYSAITPEANPYAESYRGYTYVLTFTSGAAGGTVKFDLRVALSLIGQAASPLGLQAYDPDADEFSVGAYARGDAGGGVIDVTNSTTAKAKPGNYLGAGRSTAHEGTPLLPTPTYEYQDAATLSTTFVLGENETRKFRLYASTTSEGEFLAPVPEPASFAALGLGTLAVLRRRRKA